MTLQPDKPLTWMQVTCPHCCEKAVMKIIDCGHYKICAVCPSCGNHKRLGPRALQLPLENK